MAHRIMPDKYKILQHWAYVLIENYGKYWLDVFYETDSTKAEKTCYCFACGSSVGTQRCHIIPKTLGGKDDLSNLHLLCNECHIESENIETNELYFEWLNSKSPLNSGSYLRIANKAKLFASLVDSGKTELLPSYIKELI